MLLLLPACGGNDKPVNITDPAPPDDPVSLEIEPAWQSVEKGEAAYFTVTAINTEFIVGENSAGCSKTDDTLISCATDAAAVGNHGITVTATAKPSETKTATLNITDPAPPEEPLITGSIISVVGNVGGYQTQNVVLNKIIWSDSVGAFTVSAQLPTGAGLPISSSAPSPYVFSFFNQAASGAQPRVALTDYTYTLGAAGASDFWFYDPTGEGWELKGHAGPDDMPRNAGKIANIRYNDTPYLVAADYDSLNNEGGTLWLLSMDEYDNYAKVKSLSIPNKGDYQAHVVDVFVDGSRIFILLAYFNIGEIGYEQAYMKSELRQYKLTGAGAGIAFEQVGAAVFLGENAGKLVPYTSGSDKYLFIPCRGGSYSGGGDNNGENSSISMVNITQDISLSTTERKAYVGGAYSASAPLYDFQDIAIASNGTTYVLTQGYDVDWNAEWMLYQTTAENLVSLANAVPNITINNFNNNDAFLIRTDKNFNGYFWAIGICSNGADEYMVFAKSAGASSASANGDELHFLKVGAAWSDYANSANSIISTDVLNAGAGGEGFGINSIAILPVGIK